MKIPQLHSTGSAVLATVAANLALLALEVSANNRTYTLNSDFDLGALFNVNHDVANQLQLSGTASTFPVMWIANAGEDTVSKIDTNTGRELARYRTWFGPAGVTGHYGHLGAPWNGAAPSRTAVDRDGNVYVANRQFGVGVARPVSVVKILATGGIDRNGNGVIDTSSDLNGNGRIENPSNNGSAEILPLVDSNNNKRIDPNEIQDERIAWVVEVGPDNGLGRSLSIAPNGNLWLGLFNSRTYYELNPNTGAVVSGPHTTTDTAGRTHTPYGSLVDSNNILWGASLSSSLLRMDTTAPTNRQNFVHSGGNYGIALGNGHVYLASAGSPYLDFNPATGTFFNPGRSISALGISVDSAGNIVVSGSTVSGSYRGASKLRPDGSVIWSAAAQGGTTEERGCIVDSNGDVWTVNRPQSSVSKYRSSDGALLGAFPVGDQPYTYSDATGLSVQQSNPTGTWTIVHDTGSAGMAQGTIAWVADVPSGGSLAVRVRAADTVAGLAAANYVSVTNGAQVGGGIAGRFWEVQVSLNGTWSGNTLNTPILYELTISNNSAPTVNCPAPVVAQCPGTQTLAFSAADADGDALTYTISVGGAPVQTGNVTGPINFSHNFASGVHAVTIAVSDGQRTTSCTTTVSVTSDTTAPVIACPPSITIATAAGRCDAVATYAATATDNCGSVTLAYSIPSGSVFPKGVTTVIVTATDGANNVATCTFTVTVNDVQAPVGTCVPTTNPSGNNVPAAGNNPRSGQNPDGFYQLLGSDNCDAPGALALYVKDSGSNYVAGPFAHGTRVKITQAPGGNPTTQPMAGVVPWHIRLRGDALLVVRDSSGNESVAAACLVPPAPR